MSHRSIKGVLHNFLGTYTSRYSDLDGYWLFGLLVADIQQLKINLLDATVGSNESMPITIARRLAVAKFAEQVGKASLTMSCLREANLDIFKSVDSKKGPVNGRICSGHELEFVAKVVTGFGKTFESRMTVFVAPHNPQVESRSARAI